MKTKQRLYCVTLPWSAWEPEQGDFCETVWAKDAETAIKKLAARMVDNRYDGRVSRAQLQRQYVDGAGPYAAEDVRIRIESDLLNLLAGPTGIMPSGAGVAYNCIKDLMKIYGGGQ